MPSVGRCDPPPLHRARSFDQLPNRSDAVALLAELAAEPCPFAPVPANRPLALYGAGNLGRLARDFLKIAGLECAFVVDRDAARLASDPAWSDTRLLHPDAVTASDRRDVRLLVSIATSPYGPIERALIAQGFSDVAPFYDLAESFRHRHPLSNGWFAPPPTAADCDNTKRVLAGWDDDISRAHHLQFLAWRRLREEWTFAAARVLQCARFFVPEVAGVLHDHEVLLDGGAHHGNVTEAFLKHTAGAFRQVVAVEPDPANRATLINRLQSWAPGDRRIMVLDCALADCAGTALFRDGLDYASQLSDTGRLRVALRPIDTLGVSPSVLKLHLEGAELAALAGARATLLADRPIVAATVYHNTDGIWRTPLWLMQTLPRYRFLFRLDAWCGTGAVIYAIPHERGAA
jgi:FkbM family methyltransferase